MSAVLLHVQHLLGIGHLMRASLLAHALAERFDTLVVSGGSPVEGVDFGRARLHQLPPMGAGDPAFKTLVQADGRPVDDGFRAIRRDALLALFDDIAPGVLITEMFPFGRRQSRFELLPLLDAARARQTLVVASIRDVLQWRKPARTAETTALVNRLYDLVMVHGDPTLVHLEHTFPEAAAIADKVRYTGYVAPPPPVAGGGAGDGEVIVSAGGGAVGAALLHAAAEARALSRLGDRPWRLLVGGNAEAPDLARDGVIVEPARRDFRALLGRAAVSVSQAGYNTAMDVLAARCRAVFVPFVGAGETEQSERSARLAARVGGIEVLAEDALTPTALAAAVDAASAGPRPESARLDLSGAATTVRLIADAS